MNVSFGDSNGDKKYPYFGSYGIGVTRMIGVLAEVFNDEKGLMWPENVAPFRVHLVGLSEKAETVYEKLREKGVEVLFDDRDVSAGEKFNDADLIGIPNRVVVSDRHEEDQVEVKKRNESDPKIIGIEDFISSLTHNS